jgi:hypothetical protein
MKYMIGQTLIASLVCFKYVCLLVVQSIMWTFDNTLNDLSGQYIGTGYNSPTYYTSGITGYGSALVVNSTIGQCVTVTPPLNMNYISFTWEFWIYPKIKPTGDSMFIGQCTQSNTVDQCLLIMTRNDVMWFTYGNDDAVGSTNISANKWSHMGFVYDSEANTKSIYLNGILEGIQNSSGSIQINSTILTFGCRTLNGSSSYQNFFTGYIDQMYYNSRKKIASEILDDATLVVYYRFLSTAPLIDSGPNYINGSWGGGAVSTAWGIINQAIKFPVNRSSILVTGLVLLGTSNLPFSLSLWFNTTTLNGGGTIVHISSTTTGTGWCLRFIGLTASGNVEIQIHNNTGNVVLTGPVMPTGIWNHVVYTFSTTNGIRLYVNGTLYGSIATTYVASGAADTLIFGNPLSGVSCGSSMPNKQFYGSIDEVRLYSRELTTTEVSQLYLNP